MMMNEIVYILKDMVGFLLKIVIKIMSYNST